MQWYTDNGVKKQSFTSTVVCAPILSQISEGVEKLLMNRTKAEEPVEATEPSPVLCCGEIARFARLGVVSPQDNGSVVCFSLCLLHSAVAL